jgi:hypothetical protein
LQKRLIPLFHYALNPAAMLFLGTSEGIGEFGDLFAVLDRKAKLYKRKEGAHARSATRAEASCAVLADGSAMEHPVPLPRFQQARPSRETAAARTDRAGPAAADRPGRRAGQRQGDILYLHGRTGMYLEPAPGEAGVNNILKMAREGLRPEPEHRPCTRRPRSENHRAPTGLRVKNQRRLHHRQPEHCPGVTCPCCAVRAEHRCIWCSGGRAVAGSRATAA